MLDLFQSACLIVLAALSAGSLLNLSTHSHWFIRGWDFPRLQIIAVGFVVAGAYLANHLFIIRTTADLHFFAVIAMMIFLVVWHGYRILPYSRLWRKQTLAARTTDDANRVRLVVSNVEMNNEQYQKWTSTIQREDPDVVLLLEVDDQWIEKLTPWRDNYPHQVSIPQQNCYGMLLVSRLPIIDSEVRFAVQDDIPSIHAKIRLDSGATVRVFGVHPRPPEPIRDVDSAPRDAEMMMLGKSLQTEVGPVIVAGDFNDVAWSRTTRLFLRISDLLDPRRGRGLINSFHAQHWYLRFPLDHVFHSQHFTLRSIRRLRDVGSDHFPILIELQYEPGIVEVQESLEATEEDRDLADELIDRRPPQSAAAETASVTNASIGTANPSQDRSSR